MIPVCNAKPVLLHLHPRDAGHCVVWDLGFDDSQKSLVRPPDKPEIQGLVVFGEAVNCYQPGSCEGCQLIRILCELIVRFSRITANSGFIRQRHKRAVQNMRPEVQVSYHRFGCDVGGLDVGDLDVGGLDVGRNLIRYFGGVLQGEHMAGTWKYLGLRHRNGFNK